MSALQISLHTFSPSISITSHWRFIGTLIPGTTVTTHAPSASVYTMRTYYNTSTTFSFGHILLIQILFKWTYSGWRQRKFSVGYMFSDTEDYLPRFRPRRSPDNTTNMRWLYRHSLPIWCSVANSKLTALSLSFGMVRWWFKDCFIMAQLRTNDY